MEKIILLTIPGCQPIIGNVIKEDEEFINIEYPVIMLKEDPYLYTMPYIPFAKGGMVAFNKDNIIGVAAVDEEVQDFYKTVVSEMRESKISFKKPSEAKKEVIIKPKHLH
jgi:hypothetical protein